MGVAKFLLQERVQRIAELIVVCQYHGSWESGEVIQLLRVTGAQIVAIPVPQISGKSFLPRRRFDYKKFYGFGSGDERGSVPVALVKDGDLLLLVERILHLRGLDTVRITKVKGRADEGMVLDGRVLEVDRFGNDAATQRQTTINSFTVLRLKQNSAGFLGQMAIVVLLSCCIVVLLYCCVVVLLLCCIVCVVVLCCFCCCSCF